MKTYEIKVSWIENYFFLKLISFKQEYISDRNKIEIVFIYEDWEKKNKCYLYRWESSLSHGFGYLYEVKEDGNKCIDDPYMYDVKPEDKALYEAARQLSIIIRKNI